MAVALDAIRQTHDVVILDLPSVMVSSDTLLLADLADGLIFVVRAGAASMSLVNKAIAQFDQSKLRGVVLNDVHSASPTPLRRFLGE
jgi:Mrp family chromosome partitioning ATPase